MIFLSNAIRLCEDDGMSDFRVYGALYLLRYQGLKDARGEAYSMSTFGRPAPR